MVMFVFVHFEMKFWWVWPW